MSVTKSNQNNLTSPDGNSLAVFVDINDNALKLKDINGNVEGFTTYLPPTPLTTGLLQLQGGVALSSSLTSVTDQNNTASTLKLSTTSAQFVSPLRISTDDASEMYLDCEDGSENNRFNITRNGASQQVNLNFASNPVGSTTVVGAIRTYVDGVNLSEVMAFREDGYIGIGTTTPTTNLTIYGGSDTLGITGAVNQAKSIQIARYNSSNPLNHYIGDDGNAFFGNGLTISASGGNSQLYLQVASSGRNVNIGTAGQTLLSKDMGARLGVRGSGSTSATTSLLVQNSAGTNILQVRDDARIGVLNTNPAYTLDVNGTINARFAFNQDSANANQINGIINQGGANQAVTGINCLRLNAQVSMMVGAAQAPTATLHIKGSGSTSATTSLLVQNSSGTDLLKVTDDGNVFLGSQKNLTWNTGNFIVGDTTANTMTFYVASGIGFQIGASTNSIQRATSTRELFASSDNSWDFGQQFQRYRNGWFGGELKIGDATAVNASAKVQIDSTTQGFLPPRMTTAQKNAIATPAAGLMVYDTTLNKLCVYTTAWETITSV